MLKKITKLEKLRSKDGSTRTFEIWFRQIITYDLRHVNIFL